MSPESAPGLEEPATASPAPGDRPPIALHMPVNVRNLGISIIAAGTVLAILQFAQSVIIPFVVAAILFYAFDPLIDRLQRWRVPRALSAALLLLLAVAGVSAGAYALADDVLTVVDRLPASVRKLRAEFKRPSPDPSALDSVQRTAQALDQAAADLSTPSATPRGVMRVQIEEPALKTTSYLWYGSMGALTMGGQALMVGFLTYFLLVADDLFKRKLVKHVGPTLSTKRATVQILDQISVQIERFIMVQLLTSTIVGVVTGLALWGLGLSQPAVWGIAAGVFNTIPYFGPIIVTLGLALIGFLQFGTLQMAGTVAGVALVITTLEGWLLTPILMGRVGSLNQIAIFASLLFWSWLWGVWGMLLAVPMLMATKAICDHVEELQPIADFLSD